MRHLFFALAVIGGGFVVNSAPAHAWDFPFCIQSRDTSGAGDCSYRTYAECRAAVSGRRGGCYSNPWLAYQEPYAPGRRVRRGYY